VVEKRTPGLSWTINLWRALARSSQVAVIAFLFAYIQLASSHEYFARAYRWVGLAYPVKGLQTWCRSKSITDIAVFPICSSVILPQAALSMAVHLYNNHRFDLRVPWTGSAEPGAGFVLTITGFILLVALVGNTPFVGWLIGSHC